MVHRAFSVGGKEPSRTRLILPCWCLNGRWGVRAGGPPNRDKDEEGREEEEKLARPSAADRFSESLAGERPVRLPCWPVKRGAGLPPLPPSLPPSLPLGLLSGP